MFYLVCVPALQGAFSTISKFSLLFVGVCCCCPTWYSISLNCSMFYLKTYNIHVMFPRRNTNALFNTCIIWNWKLNSCNFTPNDDGTKEIACSFCQMKFNCVYLSKANMGGKKWKRCKFSCIFANSAPLVGVNCWCEFRHSMSIHISWYVLLYVHKLRTHSREPAKLD